MVAERLPNSPFRRMSMADADAPIETVFPYLLSHGHTHVRRMYDCRLAYNLHSATTAFRASHLRGTFF
jgi:hypothetical protein